MKETASPPNDLPHARDGAANYQISPIKAWAGHQLHQKLLHAKKKERKRNDLTPYRLEKSGVCIRVFLKSSLAVRFLRNDCSAYDG